MSTYFHYAGIKLAPGSVIEPGNWGRMIHLYPHNADPNNAWRLAMELVFEEARKRKDTRLPSRLSSCFVFESRESAQAAGQGMNGHWNVLYEVELVDPDLPRHRADFDLMTACMRQDGAVFLEKARAFAVSYWAGEVAGTPEVLTGSSLRVLRAVHPATLGSTPK